MKTTRYISLFALLAAVLFGAPVAAGQAIPVDIPDTPGESPVDREREKRKERYQALWSRFFGATSVSASPILSAPGLLFDMVVEGGIEIGDGDALYFTFGARTTTDDPRASRLGPFSNDTDMAGQIFAVGYELGLKRFSSAEMLRRSTVSFSFGGYMGDDNMLYADVSPRYIIRASQYWSLPVGIKVTTAYLGQNATPIGTVGVTAGIRRHFGQRKTLK